VCLALWRILETVTDLHNILYYNVWFLHYDTLKHNTNTPHNLKGKAVPLHMTKAYGGGEV
jgi:hypothetical protein